jgi:hypothetical protein
MTHKIWVNLHLNGDVATSQVPVAKCTYVDDFRDEIKTRFGRLLNDVPSPELIVYITNIQDEIVYESEISPELYVSALPDHVNVRLRQPNSYGIFTHPF